MPEQMARLALSTSKVGTNRIDMLVMPTFYANTLLAPKVYLHAFYSMIKPCIAIHFFISNVIAAPVSTIMRPCMASLRFLGYPLYATCQGTIIMTDKAGIAIGPGL